MIHLIASREITHPEYQILEMEIVLQNYDRLTPKVARAALKVAFGNDAGGKVYDHSEGYGYRVYVSGRAKKI